MVNIKHHWCETQR